ncbi:hypothetical protein Pint_06463 [Pistacia integerrima]|uniref:Uncharacterized protein n=1 Tax=Pistacia integerrima TaxID=434235 RepID=A0ACC0Z9F5_9ROSI|nr:hypothetical protein Pint_06463 [Pistacia integerrima]
MAPRRRPRKVMPMVINSHFPHFPTKTLEWLRRSTLCDPMVMRMTLVLKKVNELLDLYVGNWSFIEESSYQVLLESILDQEEQQKLSVLTTLFTFFYPSKKKKELAKEETIYGSSSGSSALVCAEALNVALPTNEVVDPASQMDGISETSLVIHKSDDNVDTLVPPSVQGGSSQDINLDQEL